MARFLTVPEFAAEVGISRRSAYDLVARGGIPVVRIGKSVRIARDAAEAFYANGGEAA